MKIVLLSVWSIPALAQNDFMPGNGKWDLSVSTGFIIGGPCNQLNEFLHNEGYTWDLKTKKNLPVAFELNRYIKNNVQLGLIIGNNNQELIWKNNGSTNCTFNSLIINPYLTMIYKDFLFLSIGPSLNAISYLHPTGTSLTDNEFFLKPGLSLKYTLKIPGKTRFFLKYEAQYSYSGKIEPYYHIENPDHQYTFITLQAKNIFINYFYSGIGVGVRIFKKTDKRIDLIKHI